MCMICIYTYLIDFFMNIYIYLLYKLIIHFICYSLFINILYIKKNKYNKILHAIFKSSIKYLLFKYSENDYYNLQ